MKTNQKYLFLSVITTLAVMGSTLGVLSFAQTVTPLTCSVAPSTVIQNQAAIFTAAGGNGTYYWSGNNLNITNAYGNKFAVSYPNAGTYAITVTSAGQSATCTMNVISTSVPRVLACSPATQNVLLGQAATFTAIGGNGTFTWSSPDITIINPNGAGFTANYASPGLKTLTVTSAGVSDTCAVNVLGSVITTPTPPVTPSLPNTGGGFDQ
jgi:hypothetical protein